jgi:hypothetical protein
MLKRTAVISSTALFAAVACSTAVAAEWVHPRAPSLAAESSACATFSILSGDYSVGPGSTNGVYGAPQPGERFTLTFSGEGAGSFRVVGDPAGSVTLSGPANAPGTLTYTAGGSFPGGAIGVGFYFDSGSGSQTLQASCVPPTKPAPALGGRGLALLGGLLALAGLVFARRSRRGELRR